MSVTGGSGLPTDPPASATTSPRVEGFEIGKRVGQGGAANVFAARRLEDGLAVALKMVRPEVAKILGVERFLREIRIAGSIDSPYLVPLLDWGAAEGLPYYTMPLLTDGSLRDRLDRERQLALPAALQVARDLAEALRALHSHAIVHRDVKPENVLLGPEGGRARLADYGVARALSAAALEPLTSTGLVLGTPAYMSPEQGAGDPVDSRADIYAWGCVLYEMLAGEPPFNGPTAQVVIARHIAEALPSIQLARPNIPAGVEGLIRKALAKSPADRFQDMGEVLAALDGLDLTAAPATAPSSPGSRLRRLALVAVALVAALAAWQLWLRPADLDPRRVVVFPFDGGGGDPPAEAEHLAILIGSALERTEPMQWLDGGALLGADRAPGAVLPAGRAAAIARDAGARYYLNGSLLRVGDSTRIIVRLHDLEDPGNPVTSSLSGPVGRAPVDLALGAILELLPRLVGAGPRTDVVRLRERHPVAVVRWLQGEVEYRASRMRAALALFEDAVGLDSVLAPAALRGALAASWTNSDRAAPLAGLAQRHAGLLSPRERLLATALERYLGGEATAAIRAVRRALATDATWADAWLLAGEIQLHLLPGEGLDSTALLGVPAPRIWPLEQMARADFEQAVRLDSLFTPPLVHLAEISLRAGDATEADRLVARLRRAGAEPATVRRLELAQRCVRDPASVDWAAEARADRLPVFQVATQLAGTPRLDGRRCAREAFAAILAADSALGAEDWGSLVLLQGMLVAEGRPTEAVAMVDSAVVHGLPAALGLFVVDEVAGVDVGERGRQFILQLGTDYEARGAASLWLVAIWQAARGGRAEVEEVARVLAARAQRTGARRDRLMAEVTAGYATLARGDTTAAIAAFEALAPTAIHQEVEGSLWESLATERMVLARLLLARGEWARAHRVASVFDHPGVFVHQLFLPASLAVREAAARGLGDNVLAAAARQRLDGLAASSPPGRD